MTQWNKELLLRDLSARLKHNVQILADIDKTFEGGVISTLKVINLKKDWVELQSVLTPFKFDEIKPYLRPMSSMTEDEKHEFYDICTELSEDKNHFIMEGCIDSNYMLEKFNWLNAHQFDYRGLIEKNLAIDCTNLNIY